MKRQKLVVLVVALTILAVVAAVAGLNLSMHRQPNQQMSTSAVSSVKNGLQLAISVETTQYISGDSNIVPITFTITNVSNQSLNFTNLNGNSNFNFQVYNSKHEVIYAWELGAYPLVNASVPLTPNENYTRTLVWSQQSSSPSIQVSTGSYQIIGDIGENTPYQFQTAPLNITITNP
jgi:hypothetical protein